MQFIAHIREADGKIQTVEEHLLEVKALTEDYGEKLGIKHLTGLAGMLHDLGKYTEDFRTYIIEAVNNPESPPKRGSVDHSTAGGKLLFKLFHDKKIGLYTGLVAEIVGNAVISHHSYLQDFLNPDLESNYLKRVRDKEINEFEKSIKRFFQNVIDENSFIVYVEKAASELENYLKKEPEKSNEQKIMFLTKFIFSALIDGDRTNTRLFEENKTYEIDKKNGDLFQTYYQRLLTKIEDFKKHENANTPINLLRNSLSDQCDSFAESKSGIYTLSIPTGGGKTLASFRYALKHVKVYSKRHIIYVVPFTTIIEQNAEEVRKILKDNANILEHHSNIIEDVNENDENQEGIMNAQQKLKLAKDNWDSPIIFTTMVQFLNVFYAKGSRNIRRLHNLSDSVLIFDEVQKVPIPCVSLFNEALNFLKEYGRSSIILCTATQPALDFVEHKLEIDTDGEIIENLEQVVDVFKRTEIIDMASDRTFDNEQLNELIIQKMAEIQSVLVILNTKTVVKNLYQKLIESGLNIPIYHLSTSMCAAHRHRILDEVRQQLIKGNKIICVSTQLIEAGVDVSFQCVIRSLAGLDSIAQAAGRCNRHGEMGIQNVYIIDHEEENLSKLKEIQIGKQISKKILVDIKRDKRLYRGNLLSIEAMERYFQEFYSVFKSELDYFIPKLEKKMTELLTAPKSKSSYHHAYYHKNGEKNLPLLIANSYLTAAEHFRVIDSPTTTVIVPYEDGKEIIAELSGNESINDLSKLLRKAQQYTVNLFSYEKEQLSNNDALVPFLDNKIIAVKEGAYSKEFGINIHNDSDLGLNIF